MRVNINTASATATLFEHDSARIRTIVTNLGKINTRLGTGFDVAGVNGDVPNNTWCTILICVDAPGQELRVYVNGVLKVTNTAATSPQSFTPSAFIELLNNANSAFLLNYTKIWYSVDNTNWIAPRTRPDKVINGTAAEVNADAWKTGANDFT